MYLPHSFRQTAMTQSLRLSLLLFLTTLIIYILIRKLTPTQEPTVLFLKTLLTEPSQTKVLLSRNSSKPQPVQQALPLLPAVAEKKLCPRIPLPLSSLWWRLLIAPHLTHLPDRVRVGRELAIYLPLLHQTLNSQCHIKTTCHLAKPPQGLSWW